MSIIISLLVSSLSILAASYILPGVYVDSVWTAILLAVVLGVINTFIKPVLMIITFPINVITLGLFTFVTNALLVLLADWLVSGFQVQNFLWALLFSIVVSFISSILNRIF